MKKKRIIAMECVCTPDVSINSVNCNVAKVHKYTLTVTANALQV